MVCLRDTILSFWALIMLFLVTVALFMGTIFYKKT
jgi:hypothetical protein